MNKSRGLVAVLALATAGVALTACTNTNNNANGADAKPTKVTVMSHASFSLPDDLKAKFAKETGYELEILQSDDAGAMVNQVILAKDNPVADAVAGIDNTFASKAIDAGVLQPYTSKAAGAEQDQYAVDQSGTLTAFDTSDVCLNIDKSAFTSTPAPKTLADLTKPAYKDQLVVEHPASSSPGLAFMLATVSQFGADGWLDYWKALKANGVKVVSGWEDAYYTEFSGPSSQGSRPIVVSYASSPPSEVPDGATVPATEALLDTCFRQVEYTGVLTGAANPEGAKLFIDFLLSEEVQAALPTSMWVYPVKPDTALPQDWASFAPTATKTLNPSPGEIAQNRDSWTKEWIETALG